jgi:protein ImuA
MPSPLDQPQLAALRERVRSLEGRSALNRLTLPFGVPEIDKRLPGGGLLMGALHEVAGGGYDAVDGAGG